MSLTLLVTVRTAEASGALPPARRVEVLQKALADFDRGTGLANTSADQAAQAYRAAAEGFETLLADGVANGKLYYDLGNTYLQLGEVGRAILNYRRAERLIGRDPQLQANLRYARSCRRNRIERSGEKKALRTIFFWHYDSALKTRVAVGLGAYAVFWLFLIGRTLSHRRGAWGYWALAAAIVWVSAGASVGIETWGIRSTPEGVTVQDNIVVRKGNGEAYDPQFKETLYEGVEFTILEQRPGWYKIELPDHNTGWIRQSQAEVI